MVRAAKLLPVRVGDEFQHVWTQDRYSPEAVTPYPLHRRNSASSVLEPGCRSSADGQIARAAILKFQRLFPVLRNPDGRDVEPK